MEIGEAEALGGELVEDGGFDGGVAVGGEVVVAEVIGHDEDDVGFGCLGGGEELAGEEGDEGGEHGVVWHGG